MVLAMATIAQDLEPERQLDGAASDATSSTTTTVAVREEGPLPEAAPIPEPASIDRRTEDRGENPGGIRHFQMSLRVDITFFDGKNARRGMASCHITAISPSDTA